MVMFKNICGSPPRSPYKCSSYEVLISMYNLIFCVIFITVLVLWLMTIIKSALNDQKKVIVGNESKTRVFLLEREKTALFRKFFDMFRDDSEVRPRRPNYYWSEVPVVTTAEKQKAKETYFIIKDSRKTKVVEEYAVPINFDRIKFPKSVSDLDPPRNPENDRKTRDPGGSKKVGPCKKIWDEFATYCNTTSLHGLKYCGDSKISYFERLFWLVAFSGAVGFSIYFILSIYEKYDNSPVIISYNPTAVPLSAIPFPAVTICNLNQAVKSEAEKILRTGSEVDKKLLEDYCNSNYTTENDTSKANQVTSWRYYKAFITNVSQKCSDMFKLCKWKQNIIDCSTLFTTYFTDDGLCCSFNRLPKHLTFKNREEGEDSTNITAYDWSPEKGYTYETPMNATPLRPEGAGSHLGLSVIVDAAINDYYCSSIYSAGFKVLLSNPLETPKMADFGFLVSPSVEARIVIVPNINDATDTLQSIDVNKRQCFFPDEKWLRFYRTYTERNCKLECQSNHTLKMCKCVPYFLPKEVNTTICGRSNEACVDKSKELMDTAGQSGTTCNCLPGCFEVSFTKELTYGRLLEESVPAGILGQANASYFVQNMAILRFFFAETQFRKYTKSELFGFSEFLSNTGGLLGLFLGFSFLSAVEIMYYLSLKILCTVIRSAKNKKKTVQPSRPYPYYN